jgi:hypothetical protein
MAVEDTNLELVEPQAPLLNNFAFSFGHTLPLLLTKDSVPTSTQTRESVALPTVSIVGVHIALGVVYCAEIVGIHDDGP